MVREFGSVCERRKLKVNVCTIKVMRFSRYGNYGRMRVRLNGEPFEEVDRFKYQGSQVAADGGCGRDVVHRINEGYTARGVVKSVFNYRGLEINTKKCLYEGGRCNSGVVWSRGMSRGMGACTEQRHVGKC